MQEIWDTNTYELVPRPPKHIRVLGSRFIDKIKWRKRENFQLRSKATTGGKGEAPLSNYIVDRFKSRWIALGWGLKKVYKNSYALVLSYDADRVYFCLAVYYRLLIYSEDFKNFFLVGSMIEEKDTFIEQAPGFKVKGKEDMVCLLKKSLYGIPPSPRIANEYLCDVLTNKANCKRLVTEPMSFLTFDDVVPPEGAAPEVPSTKEVTVPSVATTSSTVSSVVSPDAKKKASGPFNSQSAILSGYFVDDSRHYTNDEALLNKLKNKLAENKLKGDLKKNPVKFLGLEHEYRPNSVLIHQETRWG